MLSPHDQSYAMELFETFLDKQGASISLLKNIENTDFLKIVFAILSCKGRLVLSGVGKSGHIARKCCATFASTGTPSLYIHPSEASHGDLGMVTKCDILLLVSKSGESEELIDIIDYAKRKKILLISLTHNNMNSLSKAADLNLFIPDIPEACPLNLAPTTSTLLSMILCDSLAIIACMLRGFTALDFHQYHPGGSLGQKLLRASQIMNTGSEVPIVLSGTTIQSAIIEMTRTRFGCVGVTTQDGELIGVFTDGDLRRNLSMDTLNSNVDDYMSYDPQLISADTIVSDIVGVMTEKRLPSVFVVENNRPIGIIHIHDLMGRDLIWKNP